MPPIRPDHWPAYGRGLVPGVAWAMPMAAGPFMNPLGPRMPCPLQAFGLQAASSQIELSANVILPSLGTAKNFSRAFNLPAPAAAGTQSHIAHTLAQSLARNGYGAKEVKRLIRKGKRVDRWTRFSRAAVVSLATTMPVAAAATLGSLTGGLIGAAAGGVGAAVGAPVGAFIGALVAAPFAAPLSTALYNLEHEHRHTPQGRENTARTGLSCHAIRASNLTAYGVAGAAANGPLIATQALVTGLACFAGVASGCTWGGSALIAAPLVSVAGTAMRVGMQEALGSRIPARMFGLQPATQPGNAVTWDEASMLRNLARLSTRSTAGLVADDMRAFFKLLRRRLPGALRNAITPGKGLGQTALNAVLRLGATALGAGTQGVASAVGLSNGMSGALGRVPPVSLGAAAWGAGRPIHGRQHHHHKAAQPPRMNIHPPYPERRFAKSSRCQHAL